MSKVMYKCWLTTLETDYSEEIGILLNDILLNQSVTQTDLIQLSWNVNAMGTELFTRFLTSFIYQQRRRYVYVIWYDSYPKY